MTRRIVVQQQHDPAAQVQLRDEEPNEQPVRSRALPPYFSVGGIAVRATDNRADKVTDRNDVDDEQDAAKKRMYTVITAELLIPGDGDPVKNAALVVEQGVIVWVGKAGELPHNYVDKALRRYSVPYLMPGLWDCHVHFSGDGEEDAALPPYMAFVSVHPATDGARLARGCWETVQWGYTSLRDVGGYACEVSKAVKDGTIVGPNIYGCGAVLSQLAGHGDVFSLPAGDVLQNLAVSEVRTGHFGSSVCCIVDGVHECRRAVRLQIRRGAKCIKIAASGGVMSSDDDPLRAQFSPEELDAIVDEATRMGLSVAAHVHGKPGILAAVNAGAATVEHVSFADDECIELIKKKGVVYVATAAVVQMLLDTGGEGLPKKIWDKAKLISVSHGEAYRRAIKAGVTVALGTDTGPGFPMAVELEHAVRAGMSNLEAIKAATANGPLTLGEMAPKSGQLKVGYDADLLGLTENPVDDVKVLQNRESIKWVWKGGKIFKGPGVGPWGEEAWA